MKITGNFSKKLNYFFYLTFHGNKVHSKISNGKMLKNIKNVLYGFKIKHTVIDIKNWYSYCH